MPGRLRRRRYIRLRDEIGLALLHHGQQLLHPFLGRGHPFRDRRDLVEQIAESFQDLHLRLGGVCLRGLLLTPALGGGEVDVVGRRDDDLRLLVVLHDLSVDLDLLAGEAIVE